MKRKAIQLANKTTVVSLPIKWVKENGINKGDDLNVEEDGENLIIRGSKEKSSSKITINLNHDMDKIIIRNLFFFAHTLGHDEIELKLGPKVHPDRINELASQFDGIELLKQTKDSAIFKQVVDESSKKFDEILDRAFEVTGYLADETLNLIKKKDYKSLKNLFPLERSNTRLTNHCSRILLKKWPYSKSDVLFLFMINWYLEVIADFYRKICYELALENKNKTTLSKDTITLIEKTNKLFNDYFKLFKNFDINLLTSILKDKRQIGKDTGNIFYNHKGMDPIIGHYIMDIVTYIQDSAILLLALKNKDSIK